jgi:hypothetical protein
MQKPKKEADHLSRPMTEKTKNGKIWEKVAKYRYAVYSQNKAPTRRGKINPITYTKKQRKRPTERKNALQGKKKSRPRKSRTAQVFYSYVCTLFTISSTRALQNHSLPL